MDTPPDRIELDHLLLRRCVEEDTPALHKAACESYDELHEWMPWAAEPMKPADQEAFVAFAIGGWRSGDAYVYSIFLGTELVGTVGLHARIGPGGLDIGYWVHSGHTGRGVATAGAAALTREGLALPGIDRIEIHCDEANTASAAIPRRLGYRLDRIEDHPRGAPAETGRRMIWAITAAGFKAANAG